MGQTALRDDLRAVEAALAAGRTDQALALTQDVQARYPRALAVQRVLGEVYLTQRKPREALGALDRALAGNPEDARACCARAIVQQLQGDPLAALAWYRRACDISPDDNVLRAAYRELAAGMGQPAYRPTRVGLARLYLRNQLYPHAIREWETLLAEQPDLLEAQVGLAEALWLARQTEAAAERCRRILGNVPSCVKALLVLAAIEHDAGNADEAQRLARRALDLDPDARIGLALFADRITGGDRALRALVLAEEPQSAASPSRPLESSRSRSQALADQVTARMPAQSEPIPLPQALSGDGRYMATPALARPSALPPDFHTIFAETEYMLWGQDQDQNERTGFPGTSIPAASAAHAKLAPEMPATPAASASPQEPQRADPFARSTVFVPPALRQQGVPLDETEARAAINWIQWLQAQGARPHDAAGARGTGGLPNLPVYMPDLSSTSGRLHTGLTGGGRSTGTTGSLSTGPLPTGPLPTGPLPLPSPEALRKMFADLGTDAASPRVVDSELIEDSGHAETPQDAATGHHAPVTGESGSEAPTESLGPVSEDTALPAAHAPHEEDVAMDTAGLHPSEQPERTNMQAPVGAVDPSAASGHNGAAMTLEALEQGFASSGFSAFELRPGELEALAGSVDHAPGANTLADERDQHGNDEYRHDDAATAADGLVPSPLGAAETPSELGQHEFSQPEPTDYKGRLERARQRRDQGQHSEALNEYRVILRNAPDLLPEVMDELHASMDETPDDPELHRLLGDAHIRKGDYLSALEAYNRAVALTQAHDS